MEKSVTTRIVLYWLVGLGLGLFYISLPSGTWQSGAQFHFTLEAMAALTALIVGALALMRFYSGEESTFLFIGSGFIGAGFLDGYHAIVSSPGLTPYMASGPDALMPWSWFASRQFLAIFLFLGWLAWLRQRRLGQDPGYAANTVYVFVAVFTVAVFVFLAFAPLPHAYSPDFFLHRPGEFGPAVFFLLALIGYLRKGDWRREAFDHWLVISLIIGLAGQAVFMPFSSHLFDLEFDAAHGIKLASYVCVLIGLMVSIYTASRDGDANVTRIGAILDTVYDAIILIDQRGTVQSFNPAAERTFGYSAAEVVGQNVRMLMASHDAERHDRYIGNYLATGEAKIIGLGREVIGRHKGGDEIPIELAITEMRLDNVPMFVGSCRDISERKAAERQISERTRELEIANAELDAFAYSVSHDLRAPLRGMDGFSQALLEDYGDKLDDVARDYLGRISAAGRRMGQMIDDILTLSRATRQEMHIQDVDLSAQARELVSELKARDTGRNVHIEVAPDLTARGDRKLLRIVLDNLINNAWKYTGNTEAAHIEFGSYRDDTNTVYFVRDNGAGFDMEYAGKLFGIFQRLHSTTEFEGTGVGLATVARLIRRHGGRVWAEGRVNEGATLYFTL